jgi:hypothetical protein
VAAHSESEVRLGLVVSKFDGFSVSLTGKVLEQGLRGVRASSSKASTVVPKSPTVTPKPASMVMA